MKHSPEEPPSISCRNARLERPHPPHVYNERLDDNSPQIGVAKCWGYPRQVEASHDDREPKMLGDAVKGLRDNK